MLLACRPPRLAQCMETSRLKLLGNLRGISGQSPKRCPKWRGSNKIHSIFEPKMVRFGADTARKPPQEGQTKGLWWQVLPSSCFACCIEGCPTPWSTVVPSNHPKGARNGPGATGSALSMCLKRLFLSPGWPPNPLKPAKPWGTHHLPRIL